MRKHHTTKSKESPRRHKRILADDLKMPTKSRFPRKISPKIINLRGKKKTIRKRRNASKSTLARILDELTADYSASNHGVEIRQIAGGYRMGTKPEHHDVVVGFAKSLKPPVRLSLQALETLAVIAYKQPVTVPEISEIRGVDSSGVIGTLLDRKLISTAGRKQVIGRPILYRTTKEFLLRFGLNNVAELPSMEEFEKLGDPSGWTVPNTIGRTCLKSRIADDCTAGQRDCFRVA